MCISYLIVSFNATDTKYMTGLIGMIGSGMIAVSGFSVEKNEISLPSNHLRHSELKIRRCITVGCLDIARRPNSNIKHPNINSTRKQNVIFNLTSLTRHQ